MPGYVVETIGALAAVLGTVGWLPQAIKTIRDRDTRSLSLGTNLLILATVSLWLVYGLALGSWPLIAGNLVSVVLVGIIVAMKLRHG